MNSVHLQTVGVFALVALVGWPQFAPPPTLTVWRTGSPVAPQFGAFDADERLLAAEDTTSSGRRTATRETLDSLRGSDSRRAAADAIRAGEELPTALHEMGARLNAIVGHARTVSGDPIRYARLLLRNTSTGEIEARATADQEGRFTFIDVIPSGYVVELVGIDGSVIAASELVSVENGELRQAMIRVAANSTVRAIFGGTVTAQTAREMVNRAADAGTRIVVPPVATNSPQM